MQIEVWAQVFFLDGSVSEGKRIPAETLDDREAMIQAGLNLLKSSNREEGHLLIWGAGEMFFTKITSYPSTELGILAWETSRPWFPERKSLE